MRYAAIRRQVTVAPVDYRAQACTIKGTGHRYADISRSHQGGARRAA
jgi:hypothetical protein